MSKPSRLYVSDPDLLSERERSLPHWAQAELMKLRREAKEAAATIKQLQLAHAITVDTDWFTIPNPEVNKDEVYHLWFLFPDNPHKVCSLRAGDKLLVGRKRRES
jgi:hypothetical protein